MKTKYVKPAMQVYELQQTAKLLVGSGGGMGDRGPYTPTDDNPFGTNP